MTATDVEGTRAPDDPWVLSTPPGKSELEAYRDPAADPPALVVQVGATELRYHLSCIEDLHAMLLPIQVTALAFVARRVLVCTLRVGAPTAAVGKAAIRESQTAQRRLQEDITIVRRCFSQPQRFESRW